MKYLPVIPLFLVAALASGCVTERAIRHEQQIEAAADAVKGLARSPAIQKRLGKMLVDDAVMAVGGFLWENAAETGLTGFVLAFLGIQTKKIRKKRKAKK